MNINLTLLGEMITFIIFVVITMKFIWPPLMQALNARQKKIADGIAAAEQGQKSLEAANKHSVQIISTAKQEASNIMQDAHSTVAQLIDASKSQALKEKKRILEATQSEIEQQALHAKTTVEKNISNLIIQAAEKILQKTINKKIHDNMLNTLIKHIETDGTTN